MADRVEVGFVARAHGVRGEICAVPHDPASTTLGEVAAVWIRGKRYEVEDARDTPKGFLLALAGVEDRDAADALRGSTVEVDRADLALEDGEVLIADLVGCAVRRADGTPFGVVTGLEMGPQVRLVIRDGAVEREVPLVDALVTAVDMETKVITVDLPEGWPEEQIK
jgi:16S rRNA processing protein RimM